MVFFLSKKKDLIKNYCCIKKYPTVFISNKRKNNPTKTRDIEKKSIIQIVRSIKVTISPTFYLKSRDRRTQSMLISKFSFRRNLKSPLYSPTQGWYLEKASLRFASREKKRSRVVRPQPSATTYPFSRRCVAGSIARLGTHTCGRWEKLDITFRRSNRQIVGSCGLHTRAPPPCTPADSRTGASELAR